MKEQIYTVDHKSVAVYDDAVSVEQIEEFYSELRDLSYTRNERDHVRDEHPIFSVDFQPDTFESQNDIGSKGRLLLNQFSGKTNFKLRRVYINMCHYGDMEYPHRDCPKASSNITVLYYANNRWDYRWGGETLFYEDKVTKLAVLPVPGRFAVFFGAVEHVGSIPTRICSASRFTLAMKYEEVASDNQ